MAMRNCAKCFENYWRYEVIEDMIRATCNLCEHEVEFPKKKYREKKDYTQMRMI